MPETIYLDLPEFGLRLVPLEDPRFPALFEEIQQQPQPFPVPDLRDLRSAAVLLNQSGKTIIALSVVWRYDDANGPRTHRLSNLGSSAQMDILSGRLRASQDVHTSILAGSKRLLTEQGLFGTNSDVLPDQGRIGGGFSTSASGSRGRQSTATEVSLDFVILEDGLCVGPDTGGLLNSLQQSFELQRAVAGKAVSALRSGASEGDVFELLLPLARSARSGADRRYRHAFLPMFTQMAINQLVNSTRDEQIAWFEQYAQPSGFTLHNPE